jgi:hypothetical protein
MKIDELFRIDSKSESTKKMIFRVAESTNSRCNKCAGYAHDKLCHQLPDCYNQQSQPSLQFIKLNSSEAKKATKQNLTIHLLG